MAQTVEDLLTEISKKEDALILAARYGKALLEEKESLQRELNSCRQELKKREEDLQSQRYESQKVLLQSKSDSDELITDLEHRLASVKSNLNEEQIKYANVKEEYQKAFVGLHTENSKLRAELSKLMGEKKKENEKCRKVSQALKESEVEGMATSLQHEQLQKEVDTLQNSNRSYSDEVSTLAIACERLSDELQATKTQLEYWENQYTQLNEEFICQAKELEDSQEANKQLLEHQRGATHTPTSTMSLHEELSQSINSLDMLRLTPDSLSPHQSDESNTEHNIGDMMVEEVDSIQSASLTGTLRVSDHPQTLLAWSTDSEDSDYPCQRCQKLARKIKGYKKELDSVSDQLLIAVQQKIKLQEQNEEWQSDMAEMVEQSLHQKLEEDSTKKGKTNSKRKTSSESPGKDGVRLFRHHFIKDSWIF